MDCKQKTDMLRVLIGDSKGKEDQKILLIDKEIHEKSK